MRIPTGRVGALLGELTKAGHKFSLIPYPEKKNFYMVEILSDLGKANVKAPINVKDAKTMGIKELMNTVTMGGERALLNIARAVGALGEGHLRRQVAAGFAKLNSSAGEITGAKFSNIMSLQNRSGHGIDLVAKLTEPKPPAPKWVAFECKSKMGTKYYPRLSAAQKDAANFVETRAKKAYEGLQRFLRTGGSEGKTWNDLADNFDDIEDFYKNTHDVIRVSAKVDLNKQGGQIGEIITEAW